MLYTKTTEQMRCNYGGQPVETDTQLSLVLASHLPLV